MVDEGSEPIPAMRRIMLRVEDATDRVMASWRGMRNATRPTTVVPYAGYQHPSGLDVRGRVMEETVPWSPLETDSRLANIRGVGRLFATREIAHQRVTIRFAGAEHTLLSDEEGYLSATLEGGEMPEHTRWDEAETFVDGEPSASLPILRVGRSARFGIISDIDDTVMQTGAENLARNLWTTFTGNALSRMVYRHVPELYNGLVRHDGRATNPLFYLSSSPWNLYSLIHDVATGNGVPWGPIFLRDFGIDRNKFIKGTHGQHKLGNAQRLLDQFDGLPFILIGDLGQHDAEIYARLVRDNPGRIIGVIVHQPSDRSHDAKRRHVEEIERAGVPTLLTRDYADAIELAKREGWYEPPSV